MKKRIMALLCAALVTVSSSMTAFATSPSVTQANMQSLDDLIAARVDLVIQSENTEISPAVVSNKDVAVETAKPEFEVGVLEAVQECFGTDIRVLGVKSLKNVNKKLGKSVSASVAFAVKGITAADNVKILAYNDALGVWEFLPVAVLDGEVYTILAGHSQMVMYVDGIIPEANRFKAPKKEETVEKYLAGAAGNLIGGKDANTAVELSSNLLEAPFTADVDMTMVMLAAAAFAVVMAGTGKKLIACEE